MTSRAYLTSTTIGSHTVQLSIVFDERDQGFEAALIFPKGHTPKWGATQLRYTQGRYLIGTFEHLQEAIDWLEGEAALLRALYYEPSEALLEAESTVQRNVHTTGSLLVHAIGWGFDYYFFAPDSSTPVILDETSWQERGFKRHSQFSVLTPTQGFGSHFGTATREWAGERHTYGVLNCAYMENSPYTCTTELRTKWRKINGTVCDQIEAHMHLIARDRERCHVPLRSDVYAALQS